MADFDFPDHWRVPISHLTHLIRKRRDHGPWVQKAETGNQEVVSAAGQSLRAVYKA